MTTNKMLKVLILSASASLSVGAVAVPARLVATSSPAMVADLGAVDAIQDANRRREDAVVAFAPIVSPDPLACPGMIGSKLARPNGLPHGMRPACIVPTLL